MDIFYAITGAAGTLVFIAVTFVVFAIVLDLLAGKVPSVPLTSLTPWLTGATFVGFVFLDMWSGWSWFSDLGWASVGLTIVAFVLKAVVLRRSRRAADSTADLDA